MSSDILDTNGQMEMLLGESFPELAEDPMELPCEDQGEAQDMESLAFYLWMNEEVDKEQARRAAKKKENP